MVKTYNCPKCGREVTTKDINVAKDIMLCPSCGEVSRFSEVIGVAREAAREDESRRLLSAPPPKGLKVVTDSTDMTGRIVCTYRKVSLLAIFLVPFTVVWSGFSMTGIYGAQIMRHQFDWRLSLFGLPFLVGSIALISICLFMLFGKRVLTLERGKGKFFVGVGPIGFWRRFTFDRQTRIVFGETSYRVGGGKHGGGHPLSELHLTHPDTSNTVRICAGMSEDALDYIAALLKREAGRV